MRIAEAAHHCGLTIDTIRYYEKTGLLPPIARGADGQRRFSSENVDWLILLNSLRSTGMSMKTMEHFAGLYRQGAHTMPERRKVLVEHAAQLQRRRAQLDACEELLAYKISVYDQHTDSGEEK